MSRLAARLRRHLAAPTSPRSGVVPPPMSASQGQPREPVSERLRRIAGLRAKPSQSALPGLGNMAEGHSSALAGESREAAIAVEHNVVSNRQGAYVRGRATLDGALLHGDLPLSSALRLDGEAAVLMSGDVSLAGFRPERALFFDLETTGLPRGSCRTGEADSWKRRSRAAAAGTPLAFLIGALRISDQGVVDVHQFLLRQQPDETAQLTDFCTLLDEVDYLVSFNGRSFDRNILADRMVRNRISPERILSLPHLDLLHPSARLYRSAFGSSSLAVLERRILGVARPETEISGAEVPERWTRYLHTGDPRFLYAVLDHNALDLLSLLTLGGHLTRSLRAPGLCLAEPSMLAGAARLLMQRGQPARGEALLRRLSSGSSHDEVVYAAIANLAEHLRKSGRHGEALPLWHRMMEEKGALDPRPWRAAAIALERQLQSPQRSLELVDRFIELADSSMTVRASEVQDFADRRARLKRRLGRLNQEPKNAA